MTKTDGGPSDPMERLIAHALNISETPWTGETDPHNKGLDFHLTADRIHIEVKQFHSNRISEQMERVPHVIVAQGERAVKFLGKLLAARQENHDE